MRILLICQNLHEKKKKKYHNIILINKILKSVILEVQNPPRTSHTQNVETRELAPSCPLIGIYLLCITYYYSLSYVFSPLKFISKRLLTKLNFMTTCQLLQVTRDTYLLCQ